MVEWCVCGLVVAVISAMSADLTTTAEFTADGYRELNPLARPLVEGAGARGEAILGVASAAAWVTIARAPWRWRTAAMVAGYVAHVYWVRENVRSGRARTITPIMGPVVVVRW